MGRYSTVNLVFVATLLVLVQNCIVHNRSILAAVGPNAAAATGRGKETTPPVNVGRPNARTFLVCFATTRSTLVLQSAA